MPALPGNDHTKSRAFRTALVVAAILGATALLVLLVRRPLERLLVYAPSRVLSTTPAAFGLRYDDVTLETRDGIRLHAWHVRVGQPRGLVLYLHGNAGNIEDRLPSAAAFAREALDTLLLDYRGYGRSQGVPWEEGLYLDAEAAFAWAVRRTLPMVLYGESLGGAVAVELATRRSATALCLQSTFTSLADMADRVLPVLGRWLISQRFESARKLPSIRAPLLIIHGSADDLVPQAMGARLYQLAQGQREFLVVPQAGHNDLAAHAAPEIARRVASLLARNAGRVLQGPL
jgi:fermentation-respiration switch protein FrsA (DUF1100 family)